jgi:hypothetical protein
VVDLGVCCFWSVMFLSPGQLMGLILSPGRMRE